jgi:hypothetical protein
VSPCLNTHPQHRYTYNETLGRWGALDLFFGLSYLSRRPSDAYPASDIAATGRPLHGPALEPQAAVVLLQQLQEARRYMLYCQGLRHHKPELQKKHWRILVGLGEQGWGGGHWDAAACVCV